jgi:hypothetical protein
MSNTRSFTLGAVVGIVVGATIFVLVGHFVIFGLATLGVGVAAVHLGRRIALGRAHRKTLVKR